MPLDPTLSLRVLTPTEATANSQQNVIRQQQIAREPLERRKLEVDTRKNEIDGALNEARTAFEYLSSAYDEPSYQMMRKRAQTSGIDISDLPEIYDPKFVEQAKGLTLTAKERLDAEKKAISGIQSTGFQGDMARALYDRLKASGVDELTAREQAIGSVAQRLKGSYNPATQEWNFNTGEMVPGMAMMGAGTPPATSADTLPAALTDTPSATSELTIRPDVQGGLLPPPASGGEMGPRSGAAMPVSGLMGAPDPRAKPGMTARAQAKLSDDMSVNLADKAAPVGNNPVAQATNALVMIDDLSALNEKRFTGAANAASGAYSYMFGSDAMTNEQQDRLGASAEFAQRSKAIAAELLKPTVGGSQISNADVTFVSQALSVDEKVSKAEADALIRGLKEVAARRRDILALEQQYAQAGQPFGESEIRQYYASKGINYETGAKPKPANPFAEMGDDEIRKALERGE